MESHVGNKEVSQYNENITSNVKVTPSTSKVKSKNKSNADNISHTPNKKKKLTHNQSKIKQSPVANIKNISNKSLTEDKDDDWDDDVDQDSQTAIPSDLPNYANKFGVEEVKKDRFKLCMPHINLQCTIIDEICLEGLDGITLEGR